VITAAELLAEIGDCRARYPTRGIGRGTYRRRKHDRSPLTHAPRGPSSGVNQSGWRPSQVRERCFAGGKKMYAPTDPPPAAYRQNFDIQVFADRIAAPRAWNKLAVVVHEDDHTAILNHALLQARRRAGAL
jgi:hypothetical protein